MFAIPIFHPQKDVNQYQHEIVPTLFCMKFTSITSHPCCNDCQYAWILLQRSPAVVDHFLDISNSLSVYLFLDSKQWLGKSKKINNQRMIVQVKRVLKSQFLSPKNNNNVDRLCMNFFQIQYKCAEAPQSPISKSVPPFSAVTSLPKNT